MPPASSVPRVPLLALKTAARFGPKQSAFAGTLAGRRVTREATVLREPRTHV
jgi:hypothetical protein